MNHHFHHFSSFFRYFFLILPFRSLSLFALSSMIQLKISLFIQHLGWTICSSSIFVRPTFSYFIFFLLLSSLSFHFSFSSFPVYTVLKLQPLFYSLFSLSLTLLNLFGSSLVLSFRLHHNHNFLRVCLFFNEKICIFFVSSHLPSFVFQYMSQYHLDILLFHHLYHP